MKKIIPFKKEIIFKTNLAEIISISLDHNLEIKDYLIKGNFQIDGEYKMLETSVNTEKFSYSLPFTVDIDERYIIDNASIDIDDFYYEIINNNILSISIDVQIDNLEEKPIIIEPEIEEPVIEEQFREIEKTEPIIEEKIENRCIEQEDSKSEKLENIFTNLDSNETYRSYTIYIVRENDNIDQIMEKYKTTKECLEEYNDLTEIKIGDKIIIPSE